MSRLELTKEEKMEYSDWIRTLRTTLDLTQEEFTQYAVHYAKKSKRNAVEGYTTIHRNTVINWEGNKTPVDVCSFISLAILEYDCVKQKKPLHKPMEAVVDGSAEAYLSMDLEERNTRYLYMKETLNEMLKIDLYVRNINDALLIQVARGIFSFQELKRVTAETKKIIEDTVITKEERKHLSIKTMTISIENESRQIETREDFFYLVKKYRKFFMIGNGTVGERLKKICEDKNAKISKYNFDTDVLVHIPRCKNTYSDIFSSDICISRDRLMEICYKLKLNTKEMNVVLSAAGMCQTTDEEIASEYSRLKYGYGRECELEDKLTYAIILTAYLKKYRDVTIMPPVDYMLDYFWDNGGNALLASVRQELEKFVKIYEEKEEYSQELLKVLEKYINQCDNHWHVAIIGDKGRLYDAYRQEYSHYYELPVRKISTGVKKEKCETLHFLSAFLYSLFLEKEYTGALCVRDMEELQKILEENDSQYRGIYLFLNNLMYTFLGAEPLYMNREEQIYVKIQGKAKSAFTMDKILLDLYESWLMVYDA